MPFGGFRKWGGTTFHHPKLDYRSETYGFWGSTILGNLLFSRISWTFIVL